MAMTDAERKARQRTRERAGLKAVPDPRPSRLAAAVQASVTALNLGPEYAGLAELAVFVAEQADQAESQVFAARWLAPELGKLLAELQATPASRGKPAAAGSQRSNRVVALRADYQAKRSS